MLNPPPATGVPRRDSASASILHPSSAPPSAPCPLSQFQLFGGPASILLRVDQSERRWDVRLSNGISATSNRVAISACV